MKKADKVAQDAAEMQGHLSTSMEMVNAARLVHGGRTEEPFVPLTDHEMFRNAHKFFYGGIDKPHFCR